MHFGTAQTIEKRIRSFVPSLHRWAESMACGCLRKQVGFAMFRIGKDGMFAEVCRAHNGPQAGHTCLNLVGGCGCGHSEPRLMMEAIAMGHRQQWADRMVVLGTYSPCSFCANVLVDAGLVHVVVYDVLTEHDKRGVEILNRGLPDGAVSLANLTSKRIESWV